MLNRLVKTNRLNAFQSSWIIVHCLGVIYVINSVLYFCKTDSYTNKKKCKPIKCTVDSWLFLELFVSMCFCYRFFFKSIQFL